MLKNEEEVKKKKQPRKMNDRKNSKDISRTFSGVVGSVGSVHFRIVPWSGLYFSRSILPRRVPLFQLLLFAGLFSVCFLP